VAGSAGVSRLLHAGRASPSRERGNGFERELFFNNPNGKAVCDLSRFITPNYISGLGSFTGYVESLPAFGTLEDLTTGANATINSFAAIPDYDGVGSVVDIRFDGDLGNTTSDIIQYVPSVDSVTIPVPFSSFNPGTYQVSPQQPIDMVLTVESVPEPSTIPLATTGAIGFLLLRRRNHAASGQTPSH